MAIFLQYAWLIPALPLLACALITLTPLRRSGRASGWAAIALMGLATALAIGLLAATAQGLALRDGQLVALEAAGHGGAGAFAFPEPNVVQRFAWAAAGSTSVEMGIYVDTPVAAMLAMVTVAATCIHVFSLGYMAGNPRQGRFFSFIALFVIAVAAAEAAVGLAMIIAIYRSRLTVNADEVDTLKG